MSTRERLIELGKIIPRRGEFPTIRKSLIEKGVVRPTGLTPQAAMREMLVRWSGR
jgi:hypothetical protein